MANVVTILFVAACILFWIWFERNRKKYERYYAAYSMIEGVVWPVEIPGHRPSLGDFLVTDGSPGVEGGHERVDDI